LNSSPLVEAALPFIRFSTTSQALLQLTDTTLSAFTLLFNDGGNAIVPNNAIVPPAMLNGLR
jgi:hypothetical protein